MPWLMCYNGASAHFVGHLAISDRFSRCPFTYDGGVRKKKKRKKKIEALQKRRIRTFSFADVDAGRDTRAFAPIDTSHGAIIGRCGARPNDGRNRAGGSASNAGDASTKSLLVRGCDPAMAQRARTSRRGATRSNQRPRQTCTNMSGAVAVTYSVLYILSR